MPAAAAAYCAGQQAPKHFWAMHDWLFAAQASWSGASDAAAQFRAQALALGLDPMAYDACVTDAKTAAAIQKDQQEGSQQGVRGTPAFFLGKVGDTTPPKALSGALPFEQFSQAIDALLSN